MNPDIPKIYNEYMKDGRVVAQMNQYIDTLQPLFGNTIWVTTLKHHLKEIWMEKIFWIDSRKMWINL